MNTKPKTARRTPMTPKEMSIKSGSIVFELRGINNGCIDSFMHHEADFTIKTRAQDILKTDAGVHAVVVWKNGAVIGTFQK